MEGHTTVSLPHFKGICPLCSPSLTSLGSLGAQRLHLSGSSSALTSPTPQSLVDSLSPLRLPQLAPARPSGPPRFPQLVPAVPQLQFTQLAPARPSAGPVPAARPGSLSSFPLSLSSSSSSLNSLPLVSQPPRFPQLESP